MKGLITTSAVITVIGSWVALVLLFDAMMAKTAMAQVVGITLAMACVVVPYCVTKALKEI